MPTFIRPAGRLIALAIASLYFVALTADAHAQTTTFRTKKNGSTIICGLINGKYVPGSGTGAKFVATSTSMAALKKKKDAKSKAKLKKLTAYNKLAAAVCRKGPGNSGGLNGETLFTTKCDGACHVHTKASLKGYTATQLGSWPGMPTLTATEAAAVYTFVNS